MADSSETTESVPIGKADPSKLVRPKCFGCGTENPHSLGIKPEWEGDMLVAEVVVPGKYRGFSQVAHGGISGVICDEMMGMVIGGSLDSLVATVKIEVKYKRPMFVEVPVRVEAEFKGQGERFLEAEARIIDGDGNLLCKAKGEFLKVNRELARTFVGR